MQAYILGPIHLNGKRYLLLYKRLTEFCKEYFDRVLAPYPDFWDSQESPEQFYRRTLDTVVASSLLIAEISSPSTGVGIELQMAEEHDIPCIGICQKGSEPSKTVKGLPCLQQIIYYEDVEDLSNQLAPLLKKLS